jgi:hypothetical protein
LHLLVSTLVLIIITLCRRNCKDTRTTEVDDTNRQWRTGSENIGCQETKGTHLHLQYSRNDSDAHMLFFRLFLNSLKKRCTILNEWVKDFIQGIQYPYYIFCINLRYRISFEIWRLTFGNDCCVCAHLFSQLRIAIRLKLSIYTII